MGDDELVKMQFEYAWNWFDFHARQRTTMFNFFLIFAGFIFASIAQIYRAPHPDMLVATTIAAIGCVVSLMFWGLDVRNGKLVQVGELYLRYFERNFFDGIKARCFPKDPIYGEYDPRSIGNLNIKDYVDNSANFPHQKRCKIFFNAVARHRRLNPGIILVVASVFAFGAVYFFWHFQAGR